MDSMARGTKQQEPTDNLQLGGSQGYAGAWR